MLYAVRKVYKNKELYLNEITVKENSKYEIISTKNVEKQRTQRRRKTKLNQAKHDATIWIVDTGCRLCSFVRNRLGGIALPWLDQLLDFTLLLGFIVEVLP